MATTNQKYRNIIAVLAIAPFAFACESSSDDDTTTSDGTTSSTTTNGPTSTTMTSTPTSTSTTDTTTTDTTVGTTTTTTETDTDPTDTTVGTTTSGGSTCADYGNAIGDCFGEDYVDYYTMLCDDYVATAYGYSDECGMAMEDSFACLSGLSCDDIVDGIGCEAELDAVNAACGG